MAATVQITESYKPALERLELEPGSQAAREAIGGAVVKLVQDNFRALPTNERGFPSTGYWQRAAEATSYAVDHDDVVVRVDRIGIRQRFLGGVIQPARGKFLTIPAIAETYGCQAADFSNLKVVRGVFETWWGKTTSLALAPSDWDKSKADSQNVYFWLVAQVSQEGNPDVLPSEDDMLDAASEAVGHRLNQILNNPNSK
jgi:hypothetical protein